MSFVFLFDDAKLEGLNAAYLRNPENLSFFRKKIRRTMQKHPLSL
jgi:hypothetical protein